MTRPEAGPVLGWLADGTAYYAPLGQLVRDADEDTVQCHLCGRYMRFVFGNHLHGTHGWTRDQYIAAFGLLRSTSSVSSDLSVAASRRMTVRVAGDERLRAGMAQGQDMARTGELHRRLREAVVSRGISPAAQEQTRRNVEHAHDARRRVVPQALAAFAARESIVDIAGWLRRRVLEEGATVAELAGQVGVSIAVMQRLLDEHRLRPSGRRVRERVRRARARSKLDARLRELGFAGLREYLRDRYCQRGCTIAVMRAELECRDALLRNAISRYGLGRPITGGEAEALRRAQARSGQVRAERAIGRRAQLLAELGFSDLPSYLRVRYVDQRATVTEMARELHMSLHRLLEAMDGAGIARRPRHEAMHAHRRAARSTTAPPAHDGGH